jgi:hypothetical protein
MRHAPLLLAIVPLAFAASAEAQGSGRGFFFGEPTASLTVHGGLSLPGASSELFDFTTSELTLRKGDFAGFNYGGDLGFPVSPRFEVVIGFASSGSSKRSEFRDWVDTNDEPIEQTTSFRRTPFSGTVRYHLKPRGRTIGSFAWIPAQFVPWVGLGGGAMKYEFTQVGDFIDYQTLNVFSDRFVSRGWAPFAQASVGGGWNISQHWQLTGELRYLRGSARLDDDFVGFDRLDLSGVATTFGLALRF